MMEVKCMAWRPQYSVSKTGAIIFLFFSQRSANCPCPLPFPGDLVELGPNPNSMACENPGPFIPSGRFPLITFQGILRLLLEGGVGGRSVAMSDTPFRVSAINPLEKSPVIQLSPFRPYVLFTPTSRGSWQSGRRPPGRGLLLACSFFLAKRWGS